MRTLLEMRKFERYMLNEKSPTFWEESELDLFSNFEYNNLCTEIINTGTGYYLEEVPLTCTIGSSIVPLPANHGGRVMSLRFNGVPLNYVVDDRHNTHSITPTPGPPSGWTIMGKNIILPNVADAANQLIIVHTYIPNDMVGDDAVPDFPRGYELLIPLGTVIYALMKDKQTLRDMENKYLSIKSRMLASLKPRQTFRARRVRDI